MNKYPAIIIGEFKFELTDYRVKMTNLLTGEYVGSGLEFKHDDRDFQLLIELLWKAYTRENKE